MEMGSTVYWILGIILLLIGFYFLSKSFFHDNNTSTSNQDHDKNTDIPVVPREKREPYLENVKNTSIDDASALDNFSVNSTLNPIETSTTELNTTSDSNHNKHVDALGSTLSSLEHATADILPVVEKGKPDAFDGSSSLLDEHLHEQEANDQIAILEDAQEVVSVTLLPNTSINFDGQAIMDILDAYGLKFGEMNLYHRYVNPKGTGVLLFSVMRYTNNEESQPFDIQTLSDETVDGLTFFMPLPHPKPLEAIGGMLSLSGSIARDLNGTVHSDNFEPLTTQIKDDLKEYVSKF